MKYVPKLISTHLDGSQKTCIALWKNRLLSVITSGITNGGCLSHLKQQFRVNFGPRLPALLFLWAAPGGIFPREPARTCHVIVPSQLHCNQKTFTTTKAMVLRIS